MKRFLIREDSGKAGCLFTPNGLINRKVPALLLTAALLFSSALAAETDPEMKIGSVSSDGTSIVEPVAAAPAASDGMASIPPDGDPAMPPDNPQSMPPEPAGNRTSHEGQQNGFRRVNIYWIGQFTDVSAASWCADNVRTAYEFGIMTGKTDHWFDTEGTLTVGQAIAMACRIHAGCRGTTLSLSPSNPWYQAYVDYAWANRIITETYENYHQPISRAGFAVILGASVPNEALPVISAIEEGIIPDVPRDSNCYGAIYRLYRAGILTGNDAGGTFQPYEHISRGAAAAIVSRIADPSLRKAITLGDAFLPPALETLPNRQSFGADTDPALLHLAYYRAVEVVTPYAKATVHERLYRVALALREIYDAGSPPADPGFEDAYSFLSLGVSTDVGCVRAAGLCLNIMGISYEHVHEGLNGVHQWCRVQVEPGVYWICDPVGKYCGPEPAPYDHPYRV